MAVLAGHPVIYRSIVEYLALHIAFLLDYNRSMPTASLFADNLPMRPRFTIGRMMYHPNHAKITMRMIEAFQLLTVVSPNLSNFTEMKMIRADQQQRFQNYVCL